MDKQGIVKYCVAQIQICANCKFIVKPMGAEYTPHPESICTVEWKINFVTGEKYHPLCKDVNKTGSCFYFISNQTDKPISQ